MGKKKRVNLEGQKFGMWEVVNSSYERRQAWWCMCSCGNFCKVRQDHLLSGSSTRCRICYHRSRLKAGFEDLPTEPDVDYDPDDKED